MKPPNNLLCTVHVTVCLALLCGIVTAQQLSRSQPPSDANSSSAAESFRQSDRSQKHMTLNGLAAGRLTLPSDQVLGIVTISIEDTDAGTRNRGLLAVAGLCAAPRFTQDAASKAKLSRASQPLKSLRPKLFELLKDADSNVRQSAILAIGNMDLGDGPPEIRGDLSNRLLEMFATDSAREVRIEIIKTFALVPDKQASRSNIFKQALDDDEPAVVQYGLMGVARERSVDALPQIADHLSSPERSVRMAAAQALAAFGSESRGYLADLERAANVEPDATTKQTMLGSVRVITAAK